MAQDIQPKQGIAGTPIVTDVVATPPQNETSTFSSFGPLIALLIIIFVVILGGLYLWGSMLTVEDLAPAPQASQTLEQRLPLAPEVSQTNTDIQMLGTISTSDDISAIDADIENTKLDALDSELSPMESEVNTFETQVAK